MKAIAITAVILAAISLALATYATVRAVRAESAAERAIARQGDVAIREEVLGLYAASRAAAEAGVSLEQYLAYREFGAARVRALTAIRELDERGLLAPEKSEELEDAVLNTAAPRVDFNSAH